MAKTKTILEIFVASPSDLDEERTLLDEVIAEYNLVSREAVDVRLELIKWETHTRPGFGIDPQDVINRQIGDEFDIFIGLMWGKFGSPTSRAGSGTEEEFERAFARFQANGGVRAMFYFKDAPLVPSKIEPEELAKVQSFKSKISKEFGGLYHQFVSPDDFQKLVRMHLSMLVQDILKATQPSSTPPIAKPQTQVNTVALAHIAALNEEANEEGLLDLSERAVDAMTHSVEIVLHITTTISELGDRIGGRTKELALLKARGEFQDNKAIRRVANGAAEDIELYVQRMMVDLPALSTEYSTAMDSFGKMAMLTGADSNGSTDNLAQTLEVLRSCRSAMSDAGKEVQLFRESMSLTPRLTKEYNRARKRAVAITDDFLAFLDVGQNQSMEVEQVVQKILENRSKTC